MSHEVQIDSETTHASALTVHAHQVVFALEIDVQLGVMKVHVLAYPCETRYALGAAVHNIDLQTADVIHHRNKSRET